MNNDLISREALKKAILGHCRSEIEAINHSWYDDTIISLIDNAPTVEQKYYERIIAQINPVIEERPQGEWKEWTDERWGGTRIYCPYCKENALKEYRDGLYRQVKSNFCPNCGATMGGTT